MSGIIGSVGAKALMKTENIILTTVHFKVKDEDATDSTDIVTQVYAEKYSAVVTPNAWMIANGKRAVLVVEYIIKTDPAAGTVTVQTLVDGADAVEKTLLNIAAGKQTAVHTDIIAVPLAAGTSYTVSLEAKNSDAAQTSVIDYCNIYLQIGTSSITTIQICMIENIQSLSFDIEKMTMSVWSGAVDTASMYIGKNMSSFGAYLEAGSTVNAYKYALGAESMFGVINSYITFQGSTNNADNPLIMTGLHYHRAWFE